jgi:dipeptidyl aminopeptidase/acylaminoacyl peptidase
VIGSPTFSNNDGKIGFIAGNIDVLPEVFTMKEGDYLQLSHHNDELLAGIDLGKVEEVWFKGEDGNDLQGWILTPPDFDDSMQYASILEIHGGPTAQYGFHFMHEFYYLAAQDYVVYYTNPRGGTGYGEAHCQAIVGDWGNRDYSDLMVWTDLLAGKAYIDPQKMGVTGGSYGGYMTVWIIGHTDRFQAAVTQRCVSNLTSMWGASDVNWMTQGMIGAEETKPPYEDIENYWKHSPIAYMGNAVTPTMVVHSENDFRCPIEQGEQVFVALQYRNVPSEMVRFPDESHGLSRGGRTDRRIARLNHFLRWFNTYLKNIEPETVEETE